jgi:anti-anti-sigma factor
MFETSLDNENNIITVSFEGRMDGIAVKDIEPKLHEELSLAKENNSELGVCFDLAKVGYIASSFIRVCVAVAKDVGDGKFSIINTDPMIKKTFKVAGLEEVLSVS